MSASAPRPITKPSPITGGWLPENPKDRIRFLKGIIREGREERAKTRGKKEIDPTKWDPVIQDLKNTIEDSAQLAMFFQSMFDEIPFSHRYDAVGDAYDVRASIPCYSLLIVDGTFRSLTISNFLISSIIFSTNLLAIIRT